MHETHRIDLYFMFTHREHVLKRQQHICYCSNKIVIKKKLRQKSEIRTKVHIFFKIVSEGCMSPNNLSMCATIILFIINLYFLYKL